MSLMNHRSYSWRFLIVMLLLVSMCTSGFDSETDDEFGATITSEIRYITVDGDERKLREDTWVNEDWSGGIQDVYFRRSLEDAWVLDVEGRALVDEEDYKLRLELANPDVGFVHIGYTEFRKYFDDTGGFFEPFSQPHADLDRDIHLDIGEFAVETGLTLPNFPNVVIGYKRKFKKGTKSMIEWGTTTEGGVSRKIFPASKDIVERIDILTATIDSAIKNVTINNTVRYERYRTDTTRLDDAQFVLPASSPSKTLTVDETFEYDQFSNVFHMDSQVTDKVYWSLGYLFNTLDGDSEITLQTAPFNSRFDKNWFTRDVQIDQDSHVVNVNAMFGPYHDLTIYGAVQGEKTETDGFTDAVLTEIPFSGPPAIAPEAIIDSSNDKDEFQEYIGLRFTKIRYTTVYAEGKWTQGDIALFEREFEDLEEEFERETDTEIYRQDYKAGFNTSPVRGLTITGRYRRSLFENDYDHKNDQTEQNMMFIPQEGLSAFITFQEITTDEVTAKITTHPSSHLNLSFKYQLISRDFDTKHDSVPSTGTPEGSLQSGNYDANIYSLSATMAPVTRLYITGVFSFHDTRTIAFENGADSITTYHGDVYSLLGSVGYAIDNKTDVSIQYSFSLADNFEDNSSAGLPYGLDNERHESIVTFSQDLTENLTFRLRYGYFYYNEISNGGVDDYQAHLVSMNWTVQF